MHGDDLVERILVAEDEEQMGQIAARVILNDVENALKKRGKVLMLFASAPSQYSTWRALIRMIKRKIVLRENEVNKIVAFHMDEYLGLKPEAPQSFGKILREMLFKPLGLEQENIHYFDGRAGYETAAELRKAIVKQGPNDVIEKFTRKLEEEVEPHAEEISSKFKGYGGIFDVVIGGIGKHPHVAFNDYPYADFKDKKIVRVVKLSEESRQQQVIDKEFAKIEDVPTHALTFTLPPIFGGRSIHMIIPKKYKAEAVRLTLDGPITELIPASGLKQPEVLSKVKFYLDKDSASLSELAQEAIRRRGYLVDVEK